MSFFFSTSVLWPQFVRQFHVMLFHDMSFRFSTSVLTTICILRRKLKDHAWGQPKNVWTSVPFHIVFFLPQFWPQCARLCRCYGVSSYGFLFERLRWEFIKENKKVRKQENNNSTKKAMKITKKQRKKTRTRPRKREKRFFFLDHFLDRVLVFLFLFFSCFLTFLFSFINSHLCFMSYRFFLPQFWPQCGRLCRCTRHSWCQQKSALLASSRGHNKTPF